MGDKLLLNCGAKFQHLFIISHVNYKIAMATFGAKFLDSNTGLQTIFYSACQADFPLPIFVFRRVVVAEANFTWTHNTQTVRRNLSVMPRVVFDTRTFTHEHHS